MGPGRPRRWATALCAGRPALRSAVGQQDGGTAGHGAAGLALLALLALVALVALLALLAM